MAAANKKKTHASAPNKGVLKRIDDCYKNKHVWPHQQNIQQMFNRENDLVSIPSIEQQVQFTVLKHIQKQRSGHRYAFKKNIN